MVQKGEAGCYRNSSPSMVNSPKMLLCCGFETALLRAVAAVIVVIGDAIQLLFLEYPLLPLPATSLTF